MSGLTKFVERYTPEEQRVLGCFFTTIDTGVFVIKNLPEHVKGAMLAKYSRSSKSIRRLFLDEFVNDQSTPKAKLMSERLLRLVDAFEYIDKNFVGGERAEKMYQKVLAEFGDDSVVDLGSAHVCFEGVDQVTAKAIENGRLGAYLEKSTRYVDFGKKYLIDQDGFIVGVDESGQEGHYLYREYPAITNSSLGAAYVETMDLLFDTINAIHEPVAKLLREAMPIGDQTFKVLVDGEEKDVKFSEIAWLQDTDVAAEEKKATNAYRTAIRTKTYDMTRGLLPASTMTNLGWHASFRTFEHSLHKMFASDYHPPIIDAAEAAYQQLALVAKPLTVRVKNQHGMEQIEFIREQGRRLADLARRELGTLEKPAAPTESYAKLLYYDEEAQIRVAAASLFQHTDLSLEQITERIRKGRDVRGEGATDDGLVSMVSVAAMYGAKNRRYKPPRGFELSRYTFEVVSNFGVFRDLERNRMTMHIRQPLTTKLGFDMPAIIADAGVDGKFKDAMAAVDSLHTDMLRVLPEYAQVVTTLGHRLRWIATMDARQLAWFTQLRSGREGHPDYRKLAQQMYKQVSEVHPDIVNLRTVPFVDFRPHQLERLASAHRIEKRKEALDSGG